MLLFLPWIIEGLAGPQTRNHQPPQASCIQIPFPKTCRAHQVWIFSFLECRCVNRVTACRWRQFGGEFSNGEALRWNGTDLATSALQVPCLLWDAVQVNTIVWNVCRSALSSKMLKSIASSLHI